MTWVQSLEPTQEEERTDSSKLSSDVDMHSEMFRLPALTYTHNEQGPQRSSEEVQRAPSPLHTHSEVREDKRSDKVKKMSSSELDFDLGLPRYLDKPVEDFFTTCQITV